MDTNEIDVNDISGLDLSKIYEQTVPKQFPGAFLILIYRPRHLIF
ncbi:MAG: hypothetical protein PUC71_06330 [Oscillospiraceae bacterium]|nr:hypothetical protein [Oscillospiraceae bacterium]